MSATIPKEQQTAYQRWEMNSFGENSRSSIRSPAVDSQQMAAAREEARRAGYAEGLAQGRNDGLQQGRTDAAREMNALRQLAENFREASSAAEQIIADEMLDLALDLARAMLKTALDVKPELVLPVVREAVRYLPTLQQPALLFLHPADASLVREHMLPELEKAGWKIVDDIHLARGGCRVETGSNQIDASVQVRWERIAASLGREHQWLVE